MKKSHKKARLYLYSAKKPAFPNAADGRCFSLAALDLLTGIVSAAGFVFAMVFLVMLA